LEATKNYWRINLCQALPGLGHLPLRGPDPAAKRDIDSDTAVLVQHFFRAFQSEFRSVDALSGLGQFHIEKLNHCSASVAAPSRVKPPLIALVPREDGAN
jgi:hypothetical protein